MNDQSGKDINGFRLIRRIGLGRHSEVYQAYQTTMDRDVAFKIISPQIANQPPFIQAFEARAQAIVLLEHPHVAPLYDYWRSPDGAYLVSRLLEGGNLRTAAHNGPFDLASAATLLEQLAAALWAAHRSQVLHGRITATNVLIDQDGNAYLSDFHLASVALIDEGTDIAPDCLSPEQARHELSSAQTDIYCLGVVLHEALTGIDPFADCAPAERVQKQLNAPLPPITTLSSDRAEAVNSVIQKATAKRAQDRYADALALNEAFIQAAGVGQGQPAGHLDSHATLPTASPSANDIVASLTLREQEVLQNIITGLSNKEIAQKLSLTLPGVKWHIGRIYDKLGVKSRVQAIVRARDLPLITPRETGKASSVVVGQPKRANPYKGLRPFQSADFRDFFGREALVDRLIQRMAEGGKQARFLAVIGASGSGKSSLVKAGLIPALWRGLLPGSERWFIAEMLPGEQPIEELEDALTDVAAKRVPDLRAQLLRDAHGLTQAANLVLPADDRQLVLIIDQFEQIFTQVADVRVRSHFLALLCNAVTDADSRLRIVITLRADFYDRPLQYAELGELVRSRMETVLLLTADELERAISRPAERVGVTFEPGLVATIVSEVKSQPGALPLLQYALTELFARSQGQVLTHETYRAIGGTGGALAHRADALYLELDAESQQAARQMFLRLVTLGEGVEDTGRRVPRSELMAITAEDTMDDLIDSFTAYRFLSLDNDPITRRPIIELAHEAILREWERLRTWLNESREDLRVHRRLTTAVNEWDNAQRNPSLLAMGVRLDQFKALADRRTLVLNPLETEYLQASQVADAERLAQEAARQAHIEKIARRAANFGRAAVILTAVGILAAILAVIAGTQASNAQTQMVHAVVTVTAIAQESEAINLGAKAVEQIQNPLGNDTYAALLAIRSLKVQYYGVADQALMQVASSLPVKVFSSHTDKLNAVAFSSDGRYVLTGSSDKIAKLWDTMTGKVIHTFEGHTDEIYGVSFSPDDKQVLTASADHTAKLWDAQSGALLQTFTGDTDWVYNAEFSPDGKMVLTGSEDGTARFWDPASGKELREISGTGFSAHFSPDGKTILTGGPDNTAVIHDAATGQLLQTFSKHNGSIYALAFSPDGKYVLTGSLDDTAKLWDAASGKLVRTLSGHSNSVMAVAFSPDGKYVLTGSSDTTARLWDVATGQQIRALRDNEGGVYGAAFSRDGHYMLTGGGDSTAKLWSMATGFEARTLTGHIGGIYEVAVSHDGKRMLTASDDDTAKLWDLDKYVVLQTFTGHTDVVYGAALSPDGKYALTGSFDHTAKLWDTATGKEVHTFASHTDLVLGVAFSLDGKYAVTASTDMTVKLWDLATFQEIRSFSGHTSQVWDVAFSPDGKQIVTGSADDSLKVWDVATGKEIRTLSGHTNEVYAVAFSPDGRYILSGSRDRTAKLWDAKTGQLIYTLATHAGTVDGVAFSSDSQLMLTVSADRTVRLWDVATGRELRVLRGHTDAVWDGVFLPDGKHVVTTGLDMTVKVWETDYRDFAAAICSRMLRDFTADERQQVPITDAIPTCP